MVRWGILSTARIGEEIVASARVAAAAEVVAVASRDAGRARAFAGAHGIPRAHGSYEALLEDPEVDAVYVSLPNALHVPWSIRALEAGKHVLCEKPLARRAADAEAAFDAAERSGRLLMEGIPWRFHPQAETFERLAREAEPRLVRAVFTFDLPAEDDVRWQRELDGGALLDVGCYCLSALRLVCGEPERVSAELVEGGDGVDARLAAVLRFPGGVLGTLECGMDAAGRRGVEVIGPAATVRMDPWPSPGAVTVERDGAEPETVSAEPVDLFARELDAFAERGAVRFGRADAVGQARAIEALYQAAGEGRAVTLDG